MKTFVREVEVGYQAVDGTMFMFNDNKEKAKEECKKYEESALGVVAGRLEGILIKNPLKEIKSDIKDSNGEIVKAPTSYYFDEDFARMFGYYDYDSYLFYPKTQEDVDNFFMYLSLKDVDGNIKWLRTRVVPGKIYWVAMDRDAECTLCADAQYAREVVEDHIVREDSYAQAFFNPDKYIYTKDPNDGHYCFKEV